MNLRRTVLALLVLLAGLGAFLSVRAERGSSPTSEAAARLQAEGKPFMIYFYSQTCPQCREMEAILKEVRPEFNGAVTFFEVDVNDPAEREVVLSSRARAVPTLAFYPADEKFHLLVGVVPAETLREQLRSLAAGGN